MPEAVPIQRTPAESGDKQFTFAEGSPSTVLNPCHFPPKSAVTPSGVANHIVPSGVSAIEFTVLELSPLAVVYVVKRPSLNSLTPPVSVPAQDRKSTRLNSSH